MQDDSESEDPDFGDAAFFEMSIDHLCVAGLDGYFKRVSPSWTRTLGWTQEELVSRPSLEFVHPDDRPAVLAARADLGTGVPVMAMANRYLCKDGTYRWFEWRSRSSVDHGLVYAVARDVTEQRRAEQALHDLTDSLTTTLNSIADGVIATDTSSAITQMNPVAEKLTGWSSSDAKGKSLQEVLDIVTASGVTGARLVEQAIGDRKATGPACEAQLVARDGKGLPIAFHVAPMEHVGGTVSGAVIVLRDLTAERQASAANEQLQRQLIFAERMASVGTLAAGVAHEINNPLAYVIANLDMLIEEIRPDANGSRAERVEWADLAIESRSGAERIKKIVRQLKTFSRSEDEQLTVTDLKPVLELAVNMAFAEIRHRARLVKVYDEAPLVVADDARLGQVFVNLLINAAQAVPPGAAHANEIRIVTSTDAEGRAVIEVMDSGPGIPDNVMVRVFDPFFTTKPIGVGTGLGLWVSKDIISSLGGEITVANRPSGGACFRIVLPAAPDQQATSRATDQPHARKAERASVLIVDDERAVGVVLGRVLREHDVTILTSGQDALDLLLSGTDFDVILSDLMMPDVSGIDLYDQLAHRRPEIALRMVFITGGAFTPVGEAFLKRIPNERMDKPFDAAMVRDLVQKFVKRVPTPRPSVPAAG